jgi:uncharacterized protein (DUF3084 family)
MSDLDAFDAAAFEDELINTELESVRAELLKTRIKNEQLYSENVGLRSGQALAQLEAEVKELREKVKDMAVDLENYELADSLYSEKQDYAKTLTSIGEGLKGEF